MHVLQMVLTSLMAIRTFVDLPYYLILHLLLNVLGAKKFVHIDHTDKAIQWYEF
jgi:hypothetical protein